MIFHRFLFSHEKKKEIFLDVLRKVMKMQKESLLSRILGLLLVSQRDFLVRD